MTATALKLRSNKWASTKLVAPTAGYTAGQMVKVEDTVYIIVETATVGVEVAAIYECEKIIVPKSTGSGITFAVGDIVYFDAGEAKVNNASTGNTICGRCLVAAGANDAEVEIDFKGNLPA